MLGNPLCIKLQETTNFDLRTDPGDGDQELPSYGFDGRRQTNMGCGSESQDPDAQANEQRTDSVELVA